jgi:plastocyanin
MKRLFVTACCVIALAAPALQAANVSGKVSFVARRGQTPNVAETLVWLEPAGSRPAPKKAPATYQMLTRSKMLVPHVLAIPAGSTVLFPNDDPISHNLFSLSANNQFDLGLYRRGAGKSEKFDTPGIVNVYCNVHPNMSAVIHVMASPYFGFTDASGAFALADIPPGRYRLVAWNEQGGQTESPIDVAANGNVNGSLALTLDSRSYRDAQHLNKVGKPYQNPSTRDY